MSAIRRRSVRPWPRRRGSSGRRWSPPRWRPRRGRSRRPRPRRSRPPRRRAASRSSPSWRPSAASPRSDLPSGPVLAHGCGRIPPAGCDAGQIARATGGFSGHEIMGCRVGIPTAHGRPVAGPETRSKTRSRNFRW
ncbi:MAG: hypothetical protein GC150_15385 [Rhizobiales bacterium]|nr:hypothetical protein [Hyphomicrobiales bacterium]